MPLETALAIGSVVFGVVALAVAIAANAKARVTEGVMRELLTGIVESPPDAYDSKPDLRTFSDP